MARGEFPGVVGLEHEHNHDERERIFQLYLEFRLNLARLDGKLVTSRKRRYAYTRALEDV